MKKKYKILLIIIVVLIVGVSAIGVIHVFHKSGEPEKKEAITTTVVSNIESFGYTLDDRDTPYMKEVYQELETILKEDEKIDYEKYAEVLAKLFVIDFYTLNNKINKYDVGSLEYILSDTKDMFRQKAMDTIYREMIDNTYKDRVQELPEITNVEVISVMETKFKYKEEEQDAYEVKMSYSYKKDLGYDKGGTLTFVRNGKKLEVAFYEPNEK